MFPGAATIITQREGTAVKSNVELPDCGTAMCHLFLCPNGKKNGENGKKMNKSAFF